MGQLFLEYLSGSRVYVCSTCDTHLSKHDEIISKSFHGAHGRAYLFNSVINVYTGAPIERGMTTGVHTVVDIYCIKCSTIIGWKYVKAEEESQKYKEGKFILEKSLISETSSE
eukprot:Nk52_evm3s296 gene=Nk52_evmTU3s296